MGSEGTQGSVSSFLFSRINVTIFNVRIPVYMSLWVWVCLIYCRPQRSCEGYVFIGVCLSTGGWSAPGGCRGGLLPGCLLLGGAWSQSGVCSLGGPGPGGRGCLVLGGVGIPACTEANPPRRDGYCCGRYASYWNAFLLDIRRLRSTNSNSTRWNDFLWNFGIKIGKSWSCLFYLRKHEISKMSTDSRLIKAFHSCVRSGSQRVLSSPYEPLACRVVLTVLGSHTWLELLTWDVT